MPGTANERLTLEIAAQTIGEGSINAFTDALNRFTASAERGAGVTTAIGTNMQTSVAKVALMSSALRDLDGSWENNTRMAARWLSTMPAVGTLLNANVIGFAALGGVMFEAGQKLYDFTQKHDPLIQAQKQLQDVSKGTTAALKGFNDEIAKMQQANYEFAFGKTASLFDQAGAWNAATAQPKMLADSMRADIARLTAERKSLAGGGTANGGVLDLAGTMDMDAGSGSAQANNARIAVIDKQLAMDQDRLEAAEKHITDLTMTASSLMRQGLLPRQNEIDQNAADFARRQKAAMSEFQTKFASDAFDFTNPASRANQEFFRAGYEGNNRSFESQNESDRKDQENADRMAREIQELSDWVTRDMNRMQLSQDAAQIRQWTATAEGQKRALGIGAGPDDALAIAEKSREIDQNLVDLTASLYEKHKDLYDMDEKRVDLQTKSIQLQNDFNDKLAEQLARQDQAFRSLAGGFYDAMRSGHVGGFFAGEVNGIGRTAFENAASLAESSIVKMIPHASNPNNTLGKILQGTPFGADPLKNATDANTDATRANTVALQQFRGYGGGSSGITMPGTGALADLYPTWTADSPAGGPGNPLAGLGLPELKTGGMSFATKAGISAAIAGGGFAAFEGFHSGGARGALQGSAAVASTIGAVLPLISKTLSLAGPIGMGVGAAIGLATALMGDPRQNRANDINNELNSNIYHAPTALNITSDASGNYVDRDIHGNLRSSTLLARPQVSQPYTYWGPNNTPYQVPGQVLSPFTEAPNSVHYHFHEGAIQTLDAKSFHEFAQANHHTFGDAVNKSVNAGHTPLQQSIAYFGAR